MTNEDPLGQMVIGSLATTGLSHSTNLQLPHMKLSSTLTALCFVTGTEKWVILIGQKIRIPSGVRNIKLL
jgi:hypothetical protein